MSVQNPKIDDQENPINMNRIGKRIADLRKARKLTQAEVCEALKSYGVSIQPAGLSRWENGVTEPNAEQFLALYRVLDLDPDFNFLEDDSAPLETPLSAASARTVRQYREYLTEHHVFESVRQNIRDIRLPLLIPGAPARNSEATAPYTYSCLTVPETEIPYGTDFAVRVQDGSMAPALHRGDIIYCCYTGKLLPGDLGVFVCANTLLIRRYGDPSESGDAPVLHADSPNVQALPIDSASLHIIGRVLL